MRILFVADLHYVLKQFDWLAANAERFDLVVIGGDLLDLASPLDFDVQIVVVEKYLRRIREKTRLLVSSGNHDGDSRNAADECVAAWLQEVRGDGLFVDGESAVLEGVRVTACPWWDGPVSRDELESLLEREAAKVQDGQRWIWSHHSPPDGSPVSWSGRKYDGDEYLRGWIDRFQPDVVFSGHVHNSPFYAQGAWFDRLGKTWVFNPGRQPGQSPSFIVLDLEAMVAEFVSAEGQSVHRLAAPDG